MSTAADEPRNLQGYRKAKGWLESNLSPQDPDTCLMVALPYDLGDGFDRLNTSGGLVELQFHDCPGGDFIIQEQSESFGAHILGESLALHGKQDFVLELDHMVGAGAQALFFLPGILRLILWGRLFGALFTPPVDLEYDHRQRLYQKVPIN
jgi:hypothetical protein